MHLINDVAARRDVLDRLPIPLGFKQNGQWVWKNRAAQLLQGWKASPGDAEAEPLFTGERPAQNFANQVVGEWSWYGQAWPLLVADDLETAVIVGADGRVEWANDAARRAFGAATGADWNAVETLPRWQELRGQKVSLTRGGYQFRWRSRAQRILLEAWPLPPTVSLDHIASFVHEIRNPLAALSGYVEMAKQEAPESGHYYDAMLEEIDRLSRLTADLLEIARPLTLVRDWVLLDPLVEHAWFTATHGELSPARPIALIKRYAPDQKVWADPDRLQQVLTNLIKNSVEAMQQQGSRVEIHCRQAGGKLSLTVRDDGPGIPPDVLEKLMLSRVTTKESGNGLGLMIVRRILEAHGGDVTLATDSGTVVELVWPEPG